MLFTRPGCPHCRRAKALLDGRGWAYDEIESLETIRQMVIAGLGLTLMPAMALTGEDQRRKSTAVRAFAAPAPGREIVLAHRRGSPRSEGFARLAMLVRAELPESVEPIEAARARR